MNLAVFATLAEDLGVHYLAASIGAFTVALGSNFFWNRHWSFVPDDAGHSSFQSARYLAVSAASLLLNLAILQGFVASGMDSLPAQALAVATTMPFNFIGNKLWTLS